MTDDEREKKYKLIKHQCQFLLDSFDTVQIFATKYDKESGDTFHFVSGQGNYCARYGQIKHWVISEDGHTVSHKCGEDEK